MHDPYGALIDPEFHRAGSGRGPLVGRTFAVKDLYDVAGRTTGAGNPDWLRTHALAEATSPVVTALLDAGATLTGVSHTDELAFSLNGCNHFYGTPINAAAPDRVPGGSSSGSAAAVAGGLVDFALGTDTGGSVRVPASHCGVFGIRTTHGRISKDNLIPLARSFDSVGWFARTAELLAEIGETLLPVEPGPTPQPTGFFVAEDCLAEVDPAVRAAFEATLLRLADVLGPVARGSVLSIPLDEAVEINRRISVSEAAREHGDWIRTTKPTFGPGIAERFAAALATVDDRIDAAIAARAAVARDIATRFADGRIALFPAVPAPPPRRDDETAVLEAYRSRAHRLTCPAGLAGSPQISIPAMRIDGGPVALALFGAPGSDRMLAETAIRLAAALPAVAPETTIP
ncbi:MAG: amidase [Hyphomicrobiales bacterium]|nr:amidase [Hyphomicrobiales bacterium]